MNSDALLFQDWAEIEVWLKDQEKLMGLKDAHAM